MSVRGAYAACRQPASGRAGSAHDVGRTPLLLLLAACLALLGGRALHGLARRLRSLLLGQRDAGLVHRAGDQIRGFTPPPAPSRSGWAAERPKRPMAGAHRVHLGLKTSFVGRCLRLEYLHRSKEQINATVCFSRTGWRWGRSNVTHLPVVLAERLEQSRGELLDLLGLLAVAGRRELLVVLKLLRLEDRERALGLLWLLGRWLLDFDAGLQPASRELRRRRCITVLSMAGTARQISPQRTPSCSAPCPPRQLSQISEHARSRLSATRRLVRGW